jgi:hypothetical protein
MNVHQGEPKALFLSPDGNIYPDTLICSRILPAEFNGKPYPYSQAGRIPEPLLLNPDDSSYSIDKGQLGYLCPPCAKQTLATSDTGKVTAIKIPPRTPIPALLKCRM